MQRGNGHRWDQWTNKKIRNIKDLFVKEANFYIFRQRLIQLSVILLTGLYFVPEIIGSFLDFSPDTWFFFWFRLAGIALLLLGVFCARSGRTSLGAWIVVLGWFAHLTVDRLLHAGIGTIIEFESLFLINMILAGMLLSWKGLGALFILHVLFSLTQPDINVEHLYLQSLVWLFVGFLGFFWETAFQELQRQKHYLQVIIDAIQDPLYVLDVTTYQIQIANRAARNLGFTSPNITCYALTHRRATPCTGEEHPCPLQEVMQRRAPFSTEHIHFRPDGTPYWAEVRGYPVLDEDGRVVQMVEYSLDITERKLAEEQIRKLQQAVEQAASGIMITNSDGVIEYVNPAFTRMTGYTLDETVGQTPRLLKSGHHPPEFYAAMWQTIKSGKVWQGEMLNCRKDGSLYWEYQTIAPVFDSQGRITHFVAVKLDITQQKELEAQLVAAKEAAEVANRFKTRLLANVSHDMRTPLGHIIGFAEMLLEENNLTQEQRDFLTHILRSGESLRNFIEGMLLRAELESGRLQHQPRPFPAEDLLSLLTVHKAQAERKGLSFEVEIDERLGTLYEDFFWVQRILDNLLENAVKYTSEGRIKVHMRKWDEHHWAIQVKDTGPGISPEEQEKLFIPFARQPDQETPGFGLGLSIVRDIVDFLGGTIHVESLPGQGSTFTVILPYK